MSPARPGTAPNDGAIYHGRVCVGFVRASVGGVFAYDADGLLVGSFPDRKAAATALTARAKAEAAS